MPDVYETDTTRTTWGGRDTPHVDAPNISPTMQGEQLDQRWRNRMSWGALWAGLAVSLLTWLFLNLLGIAFGAASFSPLAGGGPSASSISTGAGIWQAITSILSALAGGYAAARFAGAQTESSAGWHGLTTWALTTLALAYLLSSAIGGLLGGLGGTARSTAAQVAAPVFAQMTDPFSSIEESLQTNLSGNNPVMLRDAAIASLRTALTGGQLQAADASERAAQAIAKAQNISVEDARRQVQQYEQQYRQSVDQAKQQAVKTADEAAKAVSRAALLGAISLLLGGIFGWLGGRMALGDQSSIRDRIATASGRARR
jgi:Skp family chaperone for outer membrane proteins